MQINILIVDDEYPIRRLLKSILRGNCFRVTDVESVEQARDALEKAPFDMVITDLNMPDESGLDLINHIKEEDLELCVVVISALGNPESAAAVLEAGVYGYIVKPFSENQVLITVDNAFRRYQLEVAQKSSKKVLESRFKTIMDNLHIGLILVDPSLQIIEMNKQTTEWFNRLQFGDNLSYFNEVLLDIEGKWNFSRSADQVLDQQKSVHFQSKFSDDHLEMDFNVTMLPVTTDMGFTSSIVVMLEDYTEKLCLEHELRQAQKMEAIGQLAAGIAHEINTPIQYIGDNIRFLADSFDDLQNVLLDYEKLCFSQTDTGTDENLTRQLDELREKADLEFLEKEVPSTITQSLEGVSRVASIIKAMKEFSHPGVVEMIPADINKCLESTVTVSRNEWKYVADLTADLDSTLPLVPCLPGELNQVFLNIIINAAHAIEARIERSSDFEKGIITLSSRVEDQFVTVAISDNGGGIPPAAQKRIFDPFFTTKGIGKGTGQGLTIARNIVEEKHGGTISFETEEGKGTTFHITIPLSVEIET